MSVALDGSLEKWLRHQLAAEAQGFAGKPVLLDVGAYHGDFARALLEQANGLFQRAVLFEPNPANFAHLRDKFATSHNIQLEPLACDETAGEHEFFCAGPTYTGSLLRYDTATVEPVQKTVVQRVRLDTYLQNRALVSQVGLLKIDTQGNDLRVLRGAAELLHATRPWIVTEMIYVPLYQAQAGPHEITSWLASQGYVMAAQFNEYYTDTGWLAWADACFVPRELTATFPRAFPSRPTAEQAEREARRGFWRGLRKQIKRAFQHGRS